MTGGRHPASAASASLTSFFPCSSHAYVGYNWHMVLHKPYFKQKTPHSIFITTLANQKCGHASQRDVPVLVLLAPPGEYDWMIRQLLVGKIMSTLNLMEICSVVSTLSLMHCCKTIERLPTPRVGLWGSGSPLFFNLPRQIWWSHKVMMNN